MTAKFELQDKQNSKSLGKRALTGAGIALVLMTLFLIGVDEPDPSWSKFWFIRPLIVISVTGAMGGAFYHFMGRLRSQGGWKKALAYVLSLVVFLILLWLGSVAGLAGTLWD